ncbi:hypothetical protein [Roseibium sp.]|uniref:hypothetical protein n=1 Tax=Roseibium sp. TaxID=1936156 RepID=UPI003D15358A
MTATLSRDLPLPRSEPIAIHRVLDHFEKQSPELFGCLSENLDFRIDHFHDEADVSWQSASSLAEMAAVLQRLAVDIFPKGTKVTGMSSLDLGDGWFVTRFTHRFYYGVRQCNCESATIIVSHESDGKLDYFRETVTDVTSLE